MLVHNLFKGNFLSFNTMNNPPKHLEGRRLEWWIKNYCYSYHFNNFEEAAKKAKYFGNSNVKVTVLRGSLYLDEGFRMRLKTTKLPLSFRKEFNVNEKNVDKLIEKYEIDWVANTRNRIEEEKTKLKNQKFILYEYPEGKFFVKVSNSFLGESVPTNKPAYAHVNESQARKNYLKTINNFSSADQKRAVQELITPV